MIVNLTGHKLRLTDGRGIVVIPADGRARVVSQSETAGYVDVDGLSHPLVITKLHTSEVVGLPEPQPGVLYVVSGLVASQVPGRDDVVAPGQIDRDPVNGRVVGCRGFVKSVRKEYGGNSA